MDQACDNIEKSSKLEEELSHDDPALTTLEEELSYNNPALTTPESSHVPPPARAFSSTTGLGKGEEDAELQRVITNHYNRGWRRIVRNFVGKVVFHDRVQR